MGGYSNPRRVRCATSMGVSAHSTGVSIPQPLRQLALCKRLDWRSDRQPLIGHNSNCKWPVKPDKPLLLYISYLLRGRSESHKSAIQNFFQWNMRVKTHRIWLEVTSHIGTCCHVRLHSDVKPRSNDNHCQLTPWLRFLIVISDECFANFKSTLYALHRWNHKAGKISKTRKNRLLQAAKVARFVIGSSFS